MQFSFPLSYKGIYNKYSENEIFMALTLKNSSDSKLIRFCLCNQHYKKLYALNYTQQLQ